MSLSLSRESMFNQHYIFVLINVKNGFELQHPNIMIIESIPGENGTFRYSGFAVDAVNYMAQAFNFT